MTLIFYLRQVGSGIYLNIVGKLMYKVNGSGSTYRYYTLLPTLYLRVFHLNIFYQYVSNEYLKKSIYPLITKCLD